MRKQLSKMHRHIANTHTVMATIFLWLAMMLTISCDAASNPSAFVGRWIGVSDLDKGAIMEFLSDGTGIVAGRSGSTAIKWKTENDRLYIAATGKAKSASYKLQGSMLTLTEDNGKVSEYTKCNKDCQEAAKKYDEAKKTAVANEKAAANANLKTVVAGVKKGSFTDARDGKSYKTLKFGNQTWMAENLGYSANGSKCYDNNESNCQKYGRLYNLETAIKACPKGWHLSSDAEWQTLVDLAGGSKEAGNTLKASNGWTSNGNGVDAVGFSALPGGQGDSYGDFGYVGSNGLWWSATENNANGTYYRMYYHNAIVDRNSFDKGCYYSVRCVQD